MSPYTQLSQCLVNSECTTGNFKLVGPYIISLWRIWLRINGKSLGIMGGWGFWEVPESITGSFWGTIGSCLLLGGKSVCDTVLWQCEVALCSLRRSHCEGGCRKKSSYHRRRCMLIRLQELCTHASHASAIAVALFLQAWINKAVEWVSDSLYLHL